jgi:hypothetical protein
MTHSRAIHVTATWVMMDEHYTLVETLQDRVRDRIWAEFEDDSVQEIMVHVQPMPGEYSRAIAQRDEAKRMIEQDQDRSFSLADHLSGGGGVTHPWDQGLNIFPADHPLASMERRAREQNDEQTIAELGAAAPKLKELPRGSE